MEPHAEHDKLKNGSGQARHFCLAAEFRRAALWGAGGSVLIAVVAWFMDELVLRRGIGRRISMVSMPGAIAIWLLQYFLPRVRVDGQGIRRRILWWWDLWPWDGFADGSIRRGFGPHQYERSEYPWWRRYLNLGLLEPDDAEAIRKLIRRVWVAPPAEAIPQALTLHMKWPDQRTLHLSADGLVVSSKGRDTSYHWSDVRAVEIWRTESDRCDFCELQLRLTDQELIFRRRRHEKSEICNWTGGPSEVVSGIFLQHVEPARSRDFSLHGSPRSLEELNARESRDEAKWKKVSWDAVWCARMMWGILAAVLIFLPWPGGLTIAAVCAPLVVSFKWAHRMQAKTVEQRRSEYRTQRAELMKITYPS